MKLRLTTLLATLVMLLAIVPVTSQVGSRSALAADETEATPETETKDLLILHSGTIVEGKILEETADVVKMLVVVAGIEAPTTYRRSEILEIQRGIPVVNDLPGARKPDAADDPDDNGWGRRDEQPADSASGKPKVYKFPMKGYIVGGFPAANHLLRQGRRDIISFTPVEKTMRDALSYDPDVIIIELDADGPDIGWDGGFVAEPLTPIFKEVIDREDIKVIFWVKNALIGAAFLPFNSRDIYFESEALLGGIGTLDDFDIGDELVNEKQISLRIGAAEGLAISNGYDPAIIRGMARQQNWLCYRFRHGKVEFLEHEPREIDGEGWVILTDDGKGSNKDESEIRGNDVLNLDAQTAREIGLSKGTYDDIDDLVFALGIRGDYDLIEGRAERNFDEWRDRVELGLDRYVELQRELDAGGSGGGGRGNDAVKQIGLRTRLLKELRGLMTTYEEIFDPNGDQRAGIDVQLEQLRETLIQANKAERQRQRRSSNSRR
ncbi:MAG: hypothetical protein H6813_06915 [Phycisphaeraceae bacterium]|nr:hypothetical protein [Phycisphaeraceae bacterium]MCB9848666.1 hypothetical protein [Phycisphaeraceae bacterium]